MADGGKFPAMLCILAAFLLLLGCTENTKQKIPDTKKEIESFTQFNISKEPARPAPPGDAHKANETVSIANPNSPAGNISGKFPGMPLPGAGAAPNFTYNASADREAVLRQRQEEEMLRRLTFNDTAYNASFIRTNNSDIVEGEGCALWGGSSGCRAFLFWLDTRVRLGEFTVTAYDDWHGLRKSLEDGKILTREDGSEWYTVKFGNIAAIERDYGLNGRYERTLWALYGSRLYKFDIRADGSRKGDAEKIWKTFAINGTRGQNDYPLEWGCSGQSDCRLGEYCYSGLACIGINTSDTNLMNANFNVTSLCTNSGANRCMVECSNDSDCPRGQGCYEFRKFRQGNSSFDPYTVTFEKKLCA